ncbi:cupin domain-containing protein [Photobacterium nomapromontoriensis]|uniref:cupin domain-containing protein n=1 Tax=Photobacterium nomapromontoriensis TaxID=2910237 RepID=UPI003D145D56
MNNIFTSVPTHLPQELLNNLVISEHTRIERIVSRGHVTADGEWYDQDEHEWVMVVKGKGRILFENGMREIELNEGDYINIPAHQRHRVSWTEPDIETIWLAVFYR